MKDPELFEQCWETMTRLAPDSLNWNHYQFATQTDIKDPQVWKNFLLDPEVNDWLTQERKIMREAELAKLTTNLSNSRSVGQAQIISALSRIVGEDSQTASDGPSFVYCYVPLNDAQKQAPNVRLLEEDIFYVPDNPTPVQLDTPEPPPIPDRGYSFS